MADTQTNGRNTRINCYYASDQGRQRPERNGGVNRSTPVSIQQSGRRVDVGTVGGIHQWNFVLRPGRNGASDRIFPLLEPFSFSFSHYVSHFSRVGQTGTSRGLIGGCQRISDISGRRKDNFQGVAASAGFPDTPSMTVELLEEPDEWVDECDPQYDFQLWIEEEF